MRRLPFAMAVVVNVAVLLWPSTPGPALVPGLDKVVHVAVFAAVAWTGRGVGLRAVPLLFALATWAVASEVLQGWLPQRSGDLRDLAADLAGSVFGLLAAGATSRRETARSGTERA